MTTTVTSTVVQKEKDKEMIAVFYTSWFRIGVLLYFIYLLFVILIVIVLLKVENIYANIFGILFIFVEITTIVSLFLKKVEFYPDKMILYNLLFGRLEVKIDDIKNGYGGSAGAGLAMFRATYLLRLKKSWFTKFIYRINCNMMTYDEQLEVRQIFRKYKLIKEW